MFFRPFYRFDTGCAAYVFGCGGQGLACVVDPHEGDVDAYAEFAASKATVSPKPEGMAEILRWNRGRA